MNQLSHISRILSLCLWVLAACPALASQEIEVGAAAMDSDRQTFLDEEVHFLRSLHRTWEIEEVTPSPSSLPYRLQVAVFREKPTRRSGLAHIAWREALVRMKLISETSPVELLHHESLLFRQGGTCRIGDLKTKVFIDHQWVEISMGAGNLDAPSPRALEQGLSLRAHLVSSTQKRPGWLDLQLAWQRFPKEVRKILLGMERSFSLEEVRADFFRAALPLALGKQKAWIYRPGGRHLEGTAILMLLERLPPTAPRTTSQTSSRNPVGPGARAAWQIRIGKERWTSQGAWSPVGRPLALATLDDMWASIQEGSGQSYLANIFIEVGAAPTSEQPGMRFLNQGLRVELKVQSLGDSLWVQLQLRDRALDSLRTMPLKASLHGILKGPNLRELHLDRGFLLKPGERFPLGSGASLREGDNTQRTRLWLQIDPLRTPH